METIKVVIGGNTYTFHTGEDAKRVRALANRVDVLISAVQEAYPTVNTLQSTVLAFMNLMNEHMNLEDEIALLRSASVADTPQQEKTQASQYTHPSGTEADGVRPVTIQPTVKQVPTEAAPKQSKESASLQTRNLMREENAANLQNTERLQGVSIDPFTGKPKKPRQPMAVISDNEVQLTGQNLNPFAELRKNNGNRSYSVDPITGRPRNKSRQTGSALDPLTGEPKMQSKRRETKPAKEPIDHKRGRKGRSVNPFS